MEELWPEEGYGVVEMDEFKPPDSDDFIVLLGTFDEPEEVIIPVEKTGYKYYVHSADGDSWSREQWREFVSD